MSRSGLFAVAFAAMCVLTSGAADAQGARAADKQKPGTKLPPLKLDLAGLKKTLETGDEAAVLSALATLSSAKGPGASQAAPLVNELLVRGSSAGVLIRALEVAGELAQSSSTVPVLSYLRHRSTALRRGAASALGGTGGADAVAGLRRSLHDGDPGVRRAAVVALQRLGAREAVPDLFLVLSKPEAACDCAQGDKACKARCEKTGANMPEAAVALGTLCEKEACQKLVELVGKLPFELVERGLRPLLLRPETEVAEAFKLDVIDRMRRLQTSDARLFLESVRAAYTAEKGSVHVRHGLDAAVAGKPVPRPKP